LSSKAGGDPNARAACLLQDSGLDEFRLRMVRRQTSRCEDNTRLATPLSGLDAEINIEEAEAHGCEWLTHPKV
jgi:hypothetical protein